MNFNFDQHVIHTLFLKRSNWFIYSVFNFEAVSCLRTSEYQQAHYFMLSASEVRVQNLKQIM